MTDESLLLQFQDPSSPRRVVLEDDGRVAYAYLLKNDEIVGDVWLYNVGGDPEQVDWKDSSSMPFQNPDGYCGYEELERLSPSSLIECVWLKGGVLIRVGGELWAKVMEGSKPGWSRNAAVEGPLAKPLADVLTDGEALRRT